MALAIAQYRKEKRMTQAELAKKVGISRSFLASLETGASGVHLPSLLKSLARELGVTVDALIINGDGAAPPQRKLGRPRKPKEPIHVA